jgi:Major Facilitator Superfamily
MKPLGDGESNSRHHTADASGASDVTDVLLLLIDDEDVSAPSPAPRRVPLTPSLVVRSLSTGCTSPPGSGCCRRWRTAEPAGRVRLRARSSPADNHRERTPHGSEGDRGALLASDSLAEHTYLAGESGSEHTLADQRTSDSDAVEADSELALGSSAAVCTGFAPTWVSLPAAESSAAQSTVMPVRELPYSYAVLFLLFVAFVANQVDRQLLNYLAEPIGQSLELSDWQYGLLAGYAATIGTLVSFYPISLLARSAPRKLLLVGGVTVCAVVTMLSALTQHFWQMLLCRLLLGVADPAVTPLALSMLSDYFPPLNRPLAFAVYHVGIFVGGGLASGLGGQLSDWLGWRLSFALIGLGGLFTTSLPIALLVAEPPRLFFERGALRWRAAALECERACGGDGDDQRPSDAALDTPTSEHTGIAVVERAALDEASALLANQHLLASSTTTAAKVTAPCSSSSATISRTGSSSSSSSSSGKGRYRGDSPAAGDADDVEATVATASTAATTTTVTSTATLWMQVSEVGRFFVFSPAARYLCLAGGVRSCGGYAFGAFVPLFFTSTYGVTSGELGRVYSLIVIFCGSFSSWLGGFVAQWWRRRTGALEANVWVPALGALTSIPFVALMLTMDLLASGTSSTAYALALLCVAAAYLTAECWEGPAANAGMMIYPSAHRTQCITFYWLTLTLIGSAGPELVPLAQLLLPHLRWSLLLVLVSSYALCALLFALSGLWLRSASELEQQKQLAVGADEGGGGGGGGDGVGALICGGEARGVDTREECHHTST